MAYEGVLHIFQSFRNESLTTPGSGEGAVLLICKGFIWYILNSENMILTWRYDFLMNDYYY